MAKFHSEAVLIEHYGRVRRYLFIRIRSHAYNHPLTHPNNQPNKHFFIHPFIFVCASLRSKRFCLVSEQRKTEERDFRFWPASFFAPKPNANACYAGYVCAKFRLYSFATLETRRGLEPKCILQVVLGSLLGTRWSAIGLLFPTVPCNSSRSLCEI